MDNNDNNDNNGSASGCNLDELTARLVKQSNANTKSDAKLMIKQIRSDLELLKLNTDQLDILRDIHETLVGNDLLELEDQRETVRRSQIQLAIFKSINSGIDKAVGMLKDLTSQRTRDTLGSILVGFGAIPTMMIAASYQIMKEMVKILRDTFKGKGVLGKIFNVFFKFPAKVLAKVINNFIQSVPRLAKAAVAIGIFADKTTELFKTIGGGIGRLAGNAKDLIKVILKSIMKAFRSSGDGFFTESKNILFKIGEGISDLYLALLNSVRSFGGAAEISKSSGMFGRAIQKIVSIWKAISKIAINVGKLVGKLAWPLKIIIGVFSFVTGAMDEAGKQVGFWPKAVAGLIGGIGALFGTIIGGTMDLFKDLTGFIVGFFGAPGRAAKEMINSFSFEQIIKDMFGFLNDLVMLFVPGGKSGFGDSLSSVATKLKDTMVRVITDSFNTFIKDPIVSIFTRIGAFFAGVKAFIGSIADQGITGLIRNGIGEVLDNANMAFEAAKTSKIEGSSMAKEEQSQAMIDGSVALNAASTAQPANNVTTTVVNNGGDTVQRTTTNIGASRRQRRGFNNDSGSAHS